MSTPFTSPADSTWQVMLDEITLAYSERRQALGQAAYIPVDDTDVQAADYWSTLQSWIETNCLAFIDHVSGPLNPAEMDFLYFTLTTFRAAAGFNASGFRRVPEGIEWDGINDPGWSYGLMQAGDIIGPWIFEDLQAAFSALRDTVLNGTWTDKAEENGRWTTGYSQWIWGGEAKWEDAQTSAEDGWNNGGDNKRNKWIAIDSPMVISHGRGWGWGARITANLVRAYFYPYVSLSVVCRPRSIDLYLIGVAQGVFDANGDAITETLTVIESIAETANAIDSTFDMVGQVPRNNVFPNWCQTIIGQWDEYWRGYISQLYNLIKWNFTNQN